MPTIPSQVKVLTGEIDGVESEAEERLLLLDDLAFAEYGDSVKVTYSSGLPSIVEFFHSSSQITANRKAKADISYDGSGYPTSEVWRYYGADGTTVKRTITLTHTWTEGDLTSTTEAVS